MSWFVVMEIFWVLLEWMRLGRKSKQEKDLEILLLRHQLAILERKQDKVVRVTPHKTETSSRYFISSWQASAQDFMTAIREHWQIENGLHWVLDIAFRENDSCIRKDHAPQNMAVLRHPCSLKFAQVGDFGQSWDGCQA
jgi:predicted transposase YbfD/YdcC